MDAINTTTVEGNITAYSTDTPEFYSGGHGYVTSVDFTIAVREDSGRVISVRYYFTDRSAWQIYHSLGRGVRVRIRVEGPVSDEQSAYKGYGVIYFVNAQPDE
jgi:hypothetical protein